LEAVTVDDKIKELEDRIASLEHIIQSLTKSDCRNVKLDRAELKSLVLGAGCKVEFERSTVGPIFSFGNGEITDVESKLEDWSSQISDLSLQLDDLNDQLDDALLKLDHLKSGR